MFPVTFKLPLLIPKINNEYSIKHFIENRHANIDIIKTRNLPENIG